MCVHRISTDKLTLKSKVFIHRGITTIHNLQYFNKQEYKAAEVLENLL